MRPWSYKLGRRAGAKLWQRRLRSCARQGRTRAAGTCRQLGAGGTGLWWEEVPEHTSGCLCPAPSLGGVRAASSPTVHGRSKGGAPTSASSSQGAGGGGGCGQGMQNCLLQCSDDKTGYFIHVQAAWLLKIQARDKNQSGVFGLKTNDHTSVTSWKNKARNVVDRVTRETELIVSPEPSALLQ